MPFQIIRNDITNVKADAIVNTANPDPVCSRGMDKAVYQKAGIKDLLKCRQKIGKLKAGEAAITPAFGMDAKYIIHTVGPIWQDGDHGEKERLQSCYRNSLNLARKRKCESIAFPLISTGVYGFPKDKALDIALGEIRSFLSKNEMMIYLVVFDKESFGITEKLFPDMDSYIDDHYAETKLEEEYFEDALYNEASSRMPMPETVFMQSSQMPMPAMASSRKMSEKEKTFFQKKSRESFNGRSLEDVMAQLGETFQERLFRLIDEKNMTDVEIYKKANLDRKLFSKIRCNVDYRPKKITAVALAVALELNLDETKDLLSRAEIALSPSSKFDLIITYFIERNIYDIYTINLALFKHEQPMLGA